VDNSSKWLERDVNGTAAQLRSGAIDRKRTDDNLKHVLPEKQFKNSSFITCARCFTNEYTNNGDSTTSWLWSDLGKNNRSYQCKLQKFDCKNVNRLKS